MAGSCQNPLLPSGHDVSVRPRSGRDGGLARIVAGFTDITPRPRSVTLQNEYREDGSRLCLDATLAADGALRISGHDLGPVAEFFDGEYEWHYAVAADDVPALVVALGGRPGEDVLEMLAARYSGAESYGLGDALRASGIRYEFACWP